jgi:type IV pilus assembly protein PilF
LNAFTVPGATKSFIQQCVPMLTKWGVLAGALAMMAVFATGCTTTSDTKTQVADIAGKTTSTQRAQIHTERSAEYFKLNRMAIAVEAAQEAIKSDPSYAPAYGMLGIVYMEIREDKKAEQAFEQAVRLAPADSEILNNYGWFLCDRVAPQRSYTFFERALRNPLYTTPERARYNWGVCARRAGDLATAETQQREALVRAPQFAQAHYEIAEIQFAQKQFREADVSLGRFFSMVREPAIEPLWLAVRVARARGDRESENTYTIQMRRRFPDAPQTRLAFEGR